MTGPFSQSFVPQGQAEKPPAPEIQRVRVRLNSMADCRMEMAKIYREARSKKIDVTDASRLVNILSLISRAISEGDLETRLAALEARG